MSDRKVTTYTYILLYVDTQFSFLFSDMYIKENYSSETNHKNSEFLFSIVRISLSIINENMKIYVKLIINKMNQQKKKGLNKD
jgi:hypothetical protein